MPAAGRSLFHVGFTRSRQLRDRADRSGPLPQRRVFVSAGRFRPALDQLDCFEITSGTLDINTFGTTSGADPITTGSALATVDSNGRGTATLTTSDPASTFKLVYYVIDDNTALIFDQDTTPIATGIFLRQF